MIQRFVDFLEYYRHKPPRDPAKVFLHDRVLDATVMRLIPPQIHPNHVTVLRLFLVPIVLLFLAAGDYAVGVPLFLFAALTDALDGSLARTRKQITEWGTFYDPVADKLLIGSVVLLIVVRFINVWFGLLIVFIELLIVIGGLRRKREGHILSANVFGKTKMVLQVTGVMCILVAVWMGVNLFVDLSIGTLSLATVFAVLSLLTYGF